MPPVPAGEYLDLIRGHIRAHTALAIISTGHSPQVCENIAAELAAAGNRVVIVRGAALLQTPSPALPEESDFAPSGTPDVWSWPPPSGAPIEFFKAGPVAAPGRWLDCLRQSFDAVLLDCPPVADSPAAVELAALADVAVLVVEAGRTTKPQIQRAQRALQSRAVKLAGSILLAPR